MKAVSSMVLYLINIFFSLVYSFMKACHLNVLKSKIFLLVEMQTMLKTGRMHTGVGEKEKHMHLVV